MATDLLLDDLQAAAVAQQQQQQAQAVAQLQAQIQQVSAQQPQVITQQQLLNFLPQHQLNALTTADGTPIPYGGSGCGQYGRLSERRIPQQFLQGGGQVNQNQNGELFQTIQPVQTNCLDGQQQQQQLQQATFTIPGTTHRCQLPR
uniref:Uncharacterized protein n=1 Tax=Anopheles farauti TaxID=69004 RepID=A0A182Q4I8_9DIPT